MGDGLFFDKLRKKTIFRIQKREVVFQKRGNKVEIFGKSVKIASGIKQIK